MEIWISAEMSFLIIILYLTILSTIVLCCNLGEYEINDVCCPTCPAGTAVSKPCTATSSSSVCAPCSEGTYSDHPNGFNQCLPCKDCDPAAGLEETRKCTYISDAVCGCRAGYFCPKDNCTGRDLCTKHRECEPGQYIKVFGTAKTDTVCEDCPPGHFSKESMSSSCTPWTECSVPQKKGSSTSDSICGRSHLTVIGSVICIQVAICVIVLATRKKIMEEIKKQYNNGSPVQEQGIRSV